jgi:uncharacterized repeat protein (TIGR01451 family)
MERGRRHLRKAAASIVALCICGALSAGPAAVAGGSEHVRICHGTGSAKNPYVSIEPSKTGDVEGHDGHSDDIIPPFSYESHRQTLQYPGKNWSDGGQAIWANDCQPPAPPAPPPTPPTPPAPPTPATPPAPAVPVTPAAPVSHVDVSVTKTDAPDPVEVGGTLVYSIGAANAGPDTATKVVVSDSLPQSVSLVSVSTSQGSCSGSPTVVCNVGSLGAGAAATVTIVVTPRLAGMITNTATVTSTQVDRDPANNTATATTEVRTGDVLAASGCSDLRIGPRTLAIGRATTLHVVVLSGRRALAGLRVVVRGAGIDARGRTNAAGVARIRVLAKRSGIVRVNVPGQACSRRLGVLAASQPALTG